MATEVNLCDTILLLTRPEHASRRFSAQVEKAVGSFASTIISPLFAIVPLAIENPPGPHEEIAFTSENGVRSLSNYPQARGKAAWCVGSRTAKRACAEGYDVRTTQPTVDALIETLLKNAAGSAIVHVTGRHRRGDLAGELRKAGRTARTLIAYDQLALPLAPEALSILKTNTDIVAPVFSPRTADLLLKATAHRKARIHVVAISDSTAKTWKACSGEHVVVAPTPDAIGILSAMGSLFDAYPSA